MIRALIWKEWREQRSVVLAGLLLAALLPLFVMAGQSAWIGRTDPRGVVSAILLVYAWLLWPLFAAVSGAATLSHESGEGTIDFLLSRPVARGWLWMIKVLLAAFSWLSVVVGSLVVASLLRAIQGEPLHPSAWVGPIAPDAFEWVLATSAAALLLFAAAVFCSTLFSRAMTAGGAALSIALGTIALVMAVWVRLDVIPRPDMGWVSIELGLIALLLLGGSLALFTRAEPAARARALTRILWLGGAAVLALVVAALPVVATRSDLDPASARLAGGTITARGDAAVAALAPPDSLSAQTWFVPFDGTPAYPLTRRLTMPVDVSPDGQWVAYLSVRGPLGLRSDSARLRAVHPDGSEDRPLGIELPAEVIAHVDGGFSPSGDRLALLFGGTLHVASLEGERPRSFPLDELPGWRSLLGWTASGREMLLQRSFRNDRREFESVVEAVSVASGAVRIVKELGVAAWVGTHDWQSRAEGLERLTSFRREAEGSALFLETIDVASGRTERIATGACPFAQEVRGERLVYATCSKDEVSETVRAELHVRDLADGTDEIWAVVDGSVGELRLAPDARLLAATVYRKVPGSRHTVIVGPDGPEREFEEGWQALGWSGRSRVVLAQPHAENQRVALGDVERGTLRIVVPFGAAEPTPAGPS